MEVQFLGVNCCFVPLLQIFSKVRLIFVSYFHGEGKKFVETSVFKRIAKPKTQEVGYKCNPGVTILISLDLIRALVGLCGFTERCLLTTLCV